MTEEGLLTDYKLCRLRRGPNLSSKSDHGSFFVEVLTLDVVQEARQVCKSVCIIQFIRRFDQSHRLF